MNKFLFFLFLFNSCIGLKTNKDKTHKMCACHAKQTKFDTRKREEFELSYDTLMVPDKDGK